MCSYAFYPTLISLVVLDITILLSFYTRFKFWPPMESKFKLLLNWIPTYIFMTGIILLGFCDYNTFYLDLLLLKLIAIPLICIGLYIGISGFIAFRHRQTLGIEINELQTAGIYSLSRNPQYSGDIMWIFGYMIYCNSIYLYIAGFMAIIWFGLAPMVEEDVLVKLFGDKYINYKNNTPRFISINSILKYLKEQK